MAAPKKSAAEKKVLKNYRFSRSTVIRLRKITKARKAQATDAEARRRVNMTSVLEQLVETAPEA